MTGWAAVKNSACEEQNPGFMGLHSPLPRFTYFHPPFLLHKRSFAQRRG
jgi:hypothetical protein